MKRFPIGNVSKKFVRSGKEERLRFTRMPLKKIRRKLQSARAAFIARHGVARSLLEAGGRGHDLRVEVRGTEVLTGPRRVRDFREDLREPGRRLQSR